MLWLALAIILHLLDFISGPTISVSILFVIPVVLAARHNGAFWGCFLAVLMPLIHLLMAVTWPVPWSVLDSAINTAIRVGALAGFALLVARVTQQEREIKVLQGLLPICSWCKRIRTPARDWQQMESYITSHSEATFTHSLCPDCAKQHYGVDLDELLSGPSSPRAEQRH
jgi:hypothetical protein